MIDKRIADLLPAHYREAAPRFITFLEKYYEWLYRTSGLSDGEIEDLKNDTSWLETDIDRYVATGKLKYLDPSLSPSLIDEAIIETSSTRNSGTEAIKIPSNFTMEEDFNAYSTVDGSTFSDKNDASVELSTVENNILDGWFNSMAFDRIKRNKLKALDNIDQVLMLSLLKHIYAIKGTETSIKLFFSLFFDEDVTLYYPKQDIAVIDENFVIDGTSVIRDDVMYQEYSYVVHVANPVDTYQEIFELVYLKLFHPAGFRVQLIQQ